MTETTANTIGNVSIAVIVQALITLILTFAVVGLVAVNRTIPDVIQTAWLISIGLWLPLPSAAKENTR